tara:strand:- start:873 stop:1058 length:186 start_codon:yes stop_codon:yes gene_type:complete
MFKNSKNTSLLKEPLEKLYKIELTEEQSLESEQNLFGFFELLHQIDQRNNKINNENNGNSN